jgi:hypothetical protein
MVKIKKKLKKFKTILNSNNYQIKTRNRDKKLSSMSREIKNLQESQWLPNTNTINIKLYSGNSKNSEKIKKRVSNHFSKMKKIKKDLKKDINLNKNKKVNSNGLNSNNLNLNDHSHNISYSKNSKKNKNNHKSENAKKIQNDLYKYIYQDKEHFELKEVLGFIYDELNIDLDSPNNKIKDKEKFKIEMNNMFKKFFIIYYHKILVTPENLYLFLEYLSKFVKFDAKEVLKLLYKKCKEQKIEEKIALEQYYSPTLFLVEK